MLSIRLPAEIEAQLEFVSMKTGVSKNTIVAQALSEHLKRDELGNMALVEPIIEEAFDRYSARQLARAEQYKKAHQIADWAGRNEIWTKDGRKCTSGDVTPGIFGRNVVIGFNDALDENLYVISRYVSTSQYGTERYHLYITKYEDWMEYMIMVPSQSMR